MKIHGFGRLGDCKVNLDSKVIAVVGPNEAGKTTLLRALAYIDSNGMLSVAERTRDMTVADDDEVVRCRYILDDDDRSAVSHVAVEHPPETIEVSRPAHGDTDFLRTEPRPKKPLAPLTTALKKLRRAATKKNMTTLEEVAVANSNEECASWVTTVQTLIESLSAASDAQDPSAKVETMKSEITDASSGLTTYWDDSPLSEPLSDLAGWLADPDPEEEIRRVLSARRPRSLLFSESERDLKSSYTLSKALVEDPPPALRNLCALSSLRLADLWDAVTTGNIGARETLIQRANGALETAFHAAWKQSEVTAQFKIEGQELIILIRESGSVITPFDERSAGLRMFVAMRAFLARDTGTGPPILLVDEAELHLHIDAQADLVNTFMNQEVAAKIIYTTHSPACLPPDLGTNIRAVIPRNDNPNQSDLTGYFWQVGPGYAPLLLAMGAGAAAFSAVRRAVFVEGLSDALLLPSLIKASIGQHDLPYQVVPRIAGVTPSQYSQMELAAARVAYLVDGDPEGERYQHHLVDQGMGKNRVVKLELPALENLLQQPLYLQVVRALLEEANPGAVIPAFPSLPKAADSAWTPVLEAWAKAAFLKLPGKPVVANRLVFEERAKPSPEGRKALKKAHRLLCDALEILADPHVGGQA